ncbi:hypothetical protein ES703_58809 [subsurface metagenome]
MSQMSHEAQMPWINKIRAPFRRGKVILHEDGLLPFLKYVASVFANLFVYQSYNIYENTLDGPSMPCQVDNLTLRVITRPEEVDQLSGEGFNFSEYKERLDRGAILFCAFVDNELAHAVWVAIGRKAFDDYPFSFSMRYGSTVGVGGSFTAPKYRRKGIHAYVQSQIFRYLREKGLSRAWSVQYKDNIASQNSQIKLGSYLWGNGCHLILLRWFEFRWTRSKSRVVFRLRQVR